MNAASDLTRTRHISARVPELLAAQVDLVQARQGMAHFSTALGYVIDRGLEVIAKDLRKPERLEAMVARTEDLMVTVVAILNLTHELDPAAVEETRQLVLEQVRPKPRKPPVPDAKALGFRGDTP